MADIIDLKVKIGSSSSTMNSLPCAIDSPSPIISWVLPSGIAQKRFNVRIKPVNNSGLFINGSLTSSQTTFQYPSTSMMNSKYYGLCCLEIAISEKTSGEYEYSSGELYFVFDNVLEVLKVDNYYVFRWNNATDAETQWKDMKYNLVVSGSIGFEEENIIFDDIIDSTSKNETSYKVYFDKIYDFVYWKVRAFDGLDYGDFTQVNAFRMTNNEAPVVKINYINVLNDSTKDVIINVTISDSLSDRLNLEVYYSGGSVGSTFVLASLMNSVVCIKPGTYNIIWRSSLDEKKISGNDYNIKINAIDSDGLYGTDTSDYFYMDNLSVGADAGGEASLNNDYTIVGKMATITEHGIKRDECPLSCKNIDCNGSYNEKLSRICCGIETFCAYRTGGLNYPLSSPDFDYDSSPDDWVFDNGSSGGEDSVEPEYPKGMILFQGDSNPGDGQDLDSGEPNFTRDIEHVDENGSMWEMDERISYRDMRDIRYGYARFFYFFYACSDAICPDCGGKGWSGVERDFSVPEKNKYKYKRITCKRCMGNRFIESNGTAKEVELSRNVGNVYKNDVIFLSGGRTLLTDGFSAISDEGVMSQDSYTIDTVKKSVTFNTNARNVVIYYKMEKTEVLNSSFKISRWIPIDRYFSPLSKTELIHTCKIGNSKIIDPIVNFVFNPMPISDWFSSYSYGESNSNSGYIFSRKDLPEKLYYQVDCITLKNKMYNMNGVYNGTSFVGRTGVKNTNRINKEEYKLTGMAHVEKMQIKEDVSRVSGVFTSGMREYISGTTYDEPILMSGRDVPTWRWEPGIFVLKGMLHRENNLGSLKIIFLQSDWQVYNTIHWSGPGSASTMTQVQYCKINSNGSNGTFYDVISENSEYYEEQGVWLVPAQTWHCFWRTENQITRDNYSSYRIRIRQYNIVSKTFTSWSYSETTFMFRESATNPANIYYVEYRKFSKKLYIYFRLDDKDFDTFNITSVSYRVGDESWVEINNTYIDGEMYSLSSTPGDSGNGNKHLIVWDTSNYNLQASDDYRIRIEVIKTKFVSGYSKPYLKWYKTPNTKSDLQSRIFEQYCGVWQRFYWDENEQKAKSLNPPVFVPGRIKEIEDIIFNIKCQNEPLPSGSNGYFEFVKGVDIVKDGDTIVSANVTNAQVVDSVIIDGKEYLLKDWLNYKVGDVSRNNLIYNYSNEISSYIDIANSASDIIENSKRYVRRNLIDQGYYCNGFKNNTPVYYDDGSNSTSIDENSYFDFSVLTYFKDSFGDDGFYKPKYSEYLGDVIYSETIIDDSNGNQVSNTYDFHEYERTSDVFTRIVIDAYSTFNSQNGKPLRDIIFDESGNRIATKSGDVIYEGSNSSDYNPLFDDIPSKNDAGYISNNVTNTINETDYDTFTIPISMLPGEVDGDIMIGSSFEGSYLWKVSNYNLLYGRPEERPEFCAENTFERDIVTLNVTTKSTENLKTAIIYSIFYIDEFLEKFFISKNECKDNLVESYGEIEQENAMQETVFATDPPDDAIKMGYCSDFTWTPLSKDRSRPVVIIDDYDEKHFWYTKRNYSNETIICYAKGKTVSRVGEYDTAIPFGNNSISSEFDDAMDIFGHSVIKIGSVYLMYYILRCSSGFKIGVSNSSNAYTWNKGDVYGIDSGAYSIFVKKNEDKILMYYCAMVDGKSVVFVSESSDGNYFYNKKEYFNNSNNNISNIFVLDFNNEEILFYTEEEEYDGNYIYKIKNNSNGIFPEIINASNPYIIKENNGYRMFFDRNGKIYSVFLKNYIEKNIVKQSGYLGSVVSGSLEVQSKTYGFNTQIRINRAYTSFYNTYCTDEFRTMDLNNIKGWVIFGDNSSKCNQFRIEGEFLTKDNMLECGGEMEPMPFKYMEIVKDLYI